MRKSKTIISIILSGVLSITAASVNYSDAFTADTSDFKISKELSDKMSFAKDDDLISIGIKIKDLNGSVIDDLIEQKSDFQVSDYLDIETYKNGIMQNIITETEKEYGFEKAHITPLINPDTQEVLFESDIYYSQSSLKGKILSEMNSDERIKYLMSKVSADESRKLSTETPGMSLITKRISDDIDSYMHVRRKCVIEAYKNYNKDFIDEYIDDSHVITNVGFAPYLIVEADKSTIQEISENDNVIEIEYFQDKELTPSLSKTCNVTGVSATQGNAYNNGSGYTGTNVNIGIMEAASGKYKSSYSMLNGCSNLSYLYNGLYNGNDSDWHATLVTSIIKGKSTNYNGTTYRGIAPDATVYQTSCNSLGHVSLILEMLSSDYDVSIVNYSANVNSFQSYTTTDWEIDQAINNLGMVFVISAGNNTVGVQSPANAYNCIAVGNLNTSGTATPYPVNSSSAYATSNMTNKPDIVAPGTLIKFPENKQDSGTSLSAPVVTGIAAQLLQCDPTLKLPSSTSNQKTYFNAVKSYLLLGADPTKVSTINNDIKGSGTCSSLVREKSGAGLVNSKNCIDIIKKNGCYSRLRKIKLYSNGTSYEGLNILTDIDAGEKVRAVLCFSKIKSGRNINLNLKLYDANMNVLATSVSGTNNIEIIEYQIPAYGNYFIAVEPESSADLSYIGSDYLPGALAYYETASD